VYEFLEILAGMLQQTCNIYCAVSTANMVCLKRGFHPIQRNECN